MPPVRLPYSDKGFDLDAWLANPKARPYKKFGEYKLVETTAPGIDEVPQSIKQYWMEPLNIEKKDRWPEEIEFTDLFPKFYFNLLVHGEPWEQRLAENRITNVYANNYLMRQVRDYPRALDIMKAIHEQFTADGMQVHMGNLMALLGDTRCADLGPLNGVSANTKPLDFDVNEYFKPPPGSWD